MPTPELFGFNKEANKPFLTLHKKGYQFQLFPPSVNPVVQPSKGTHAAQYLTKWLQKMTSQDVNSHGPARLHGLTQEIIHNVGPGHILPVLMPYAPSLSPGIGVGMEIDLRHNGVNKTVDVIMLDPHNRVHMFEIGNNHQKKGRQLRQQIALFTQAFPSTPVIGWTAAYQRNKAAKKVVDVTFCLQYPLIDLL